VHLLVDAISKTRTTPHHKDTTWSRIKPIGRTDDADRGTCDLDVFGTLLCPGGGGGSCTICRRRRRKICFFPFTVCFRGPKWPGCERQEVAPQEKRETCACALISTSRFAPLSAWTPRD
jgi:hypothetical protein